MKVSPAAAVLALVLSSGCRAPETAPPRSRAIQPRQAGAWEGTGNKTIGFVSESGVFRIDWKTRRISASGAATFRLTVRSAISGRPIRVIADQEDSGSGTVNFVDDPRMYEFIVDSAGVNWSFSAAE